MFGFNYSFSEVSSILGKSCIRREYKNIIKDNHDCDDDSEENMCEYDDIEEVFNDHLLMGKRLRKTLYAGNLSDEDDPPDHPPIALTGLALELFSKAVPNDGLDILNMDYAAYATEATRITPCAMIVAMIYLERLQLKKSDYLEVVSPPGLFAVTMLVASKFLFEDDDDIVTNQIFADALNLDVKELNNLEREFLAAIEWKVFVNSSDYFNFLCKIEKIIAVRQSSLRRWLSYSDICAIVNDKAIETFWVPCLKKIMKVMVLWTVGYVTTALALYGTSVFLYKFFQGQNLNNLPEIGSTSEFNNHALSISTNCDNHTFVDMDGFLSINLPLKTLDQQNFESPDAEMADKNHGICKIYSPKIISPYTSLNRSWFQLLTEKKMKTLIPNLTQEFIFVNISHLNPGTYCQRNVNCFSLLL